MYHFSSIYNFQIYSSNLFCGTVIPGLMRGMSTLPQVTPGTISGQRQKLEDPQVRFE